MFNNILLNHYILDSAIAIVILLRFKNNLMHFGLFQVASIRQHLADIYERNQNWKEAANVLVGIPLETGQK